jgi:hypothetical protein
MMHIPERSCEQPSSVHCTMQVALVGLLVSKVVTDADITFHVYDGTGTIACRAFQDGSEAVRL